MTPLPAWTAETVAFVGREVPFEQLVSHLGQAVESGLRFVAVEGEAGIGKSRFLLESARRLARDAIVLPIHVHDVFSPALHAFARVLAGANLALSDEELSAVVSRVPNFPAGSARVREVASGLLSGESLSGRFPDEDVLRFMAPWIAALSGKAPVVVMIDDLDNAGASVLHVIGQLAVLSMPKRVLVVGSVRTPSAQSSSLLKRLIIAFDRAGWAGQISLAPLGRSDLEELLDRMHIAPRAGLASRLYELTSGNPLLLAELLSVGTPEESVDHWTSPPRIRDLARKRTAELGRATAECLQFASLFEGDFTVEILADAARTSIASVATLIDRATNAHVLQHSSLRSYRFTHQLFRQALLADLPVDKRTDGHRQIATALERIHPAPEPALLAAHWSGASGADVPDKVLKYARAAGRASMRVLEPGTAVKWLELALANLPNHDVDRGSLLAELADAQQLAGDPNGIASLQEAVRIALDTHDDTLTLQIVQVITPGWSTLPGVNGPSTQQLLARALTITDDEATRSHILARQAVALHTHDPVAAKQCADEAVSLARQSHDRVALLESLLRRASFSLTPHNLADRCSALQEVRDLRSALTRTCGPPGPSSAAAAPVSRMASSPRPPQVRFGKVPPRAYVQREAAVPCRPATR